MAFFFLLLFFNHLLFLPLISRFAGQKVTRIKMDNRYTISLSRLAQKIIVVNGICILLEAHSALASFGSYKTNQISSFVNAQIALRGSCMPLPSTSSSRGYPLIFTISWYEPEQSNRWRWRVENAMRSFSYTAVSDANSSGDKCHYEPSNATS